MRRQNRAPTSPQRKRYTTHKARARSVFGSCSSGKPYCCRSSAEIRLCELGWCCDSGARPGKKRFVVEPSSYHMVHHSRNHGYEFDAGYQVVFVVFSTTQLQQAVVLAPGDKARRYHGSSGLPLHLELCSWLFLVPVTTTEVIVTTRSHGL